MSTQLLEAAVLSLEATTLIIDQVLNEARREKNAKVKVVLDSVFKDLLGAMSDCAEKANTGEDEGKTGQTPAEAPPAPPAKPIDIILEMLQDPRYTLRSFKSIEEKTGLDQEDVCQLLDAEGYEFVVKTKRDSDEQVVGLEARN